MKAPKPRNPTPPGRRRVWFRWLSGLAFGLFAGQAFGQGSSVLLLEHPTAAPSPFQRGDCLEILHADAPTCDPQQVVIVDSKKWPWVQVQTPTGKTWINFSHVMRARITKSDR